MWRRVHTAAELGAAVAEQRKRSGMSQQELAEWLGVDRTTVIRLEAGSVGALARLMTALSALGADLVVVDRAAAVTVSDTSRLGDAVQDDLHGGSGDGA